MRERRIGWRRWAAFALAAGFAAGPAQALEVRVDHDVEFDFGSLQTFGWMPSDRLPGRARIPENDATIREEVETALKARGFERAEAPDFLVVYYVGLQDQVNVRRESGGMHVTPYEEGTLILELFALGRERPIWRGEAEVALDRERLRRQVRKIVRRLLKRFPPS